MSVSGPLSGRPEDAQTATAPACGRCISSSAKLFTAGASKCPARQQSEATNGVRALVRASTSAAVSNPCELHLTLVPCPE